MKGDNLEPSGEYAGQLDHVPVGEVEGLKPGDGGLGEICPAVLAQCQPRLLLGETQCQSKQIQEHYSSYSSANLPLFSEQCRKRLQIL